MKEVKEEVPFNYFFIMFEQEIQKRTRKKNEEKLLEDEELDEDDIYILSKEEQLQICKESFYEILISYLSLTENDTITICPKEPLDLCNLILNNMEDNPYKESLLKSVQFIMARYLEMLGKGCPTIMFSNDDKKEKSFRVVYDRSQRINNFDSTNMSLEERTGMMVKVLRNTIENNMVLMPLVRYESRTDI